MIMEDKELLEYIYKTVNMGAHSSEKLLENLKDKDNKIKDAIEDIKKEYLKFQKELKKDTKKYKKDLEDIGLIAKLGSSMEMKMEVMKDNSDSKIADMLIRGLTMGVVETEKYIHKLEEKTDKDIVKLAKDLLDFQNESIKKLKEYL